MSVTAKFEYDADEHYRALREVSRSFAWTWISRAFAVGLLVFIIVVVVINWRTADPAELFLASLPWIILAVFWGTFLPLYQKRLAKHLPERDPSARGPQERVVDEVGYHSRGNGVVFEMPWDTIHKVIETDEFFIFYFTRETSYYIPKRVLSAGRISELRHLILSHLRDRAKLLAS